MKKPGFRFTKQYIQRICEKLESDQTTVRSFPDWGSLHIDRQLPFVCLYRRPRGQNDRGTERLLLGQASYIVIDEEAAESPGFITLLQSIMSTLCHIFGSVLLFELWSEESSATDIDKQSMQPVKFGIRTTTKQAPLDMLESLESALLEIPFEKRNSSISLDYVDQCHPPGMLPLFCQMEFAREGYYWVGLSVTAIYRHKKDFFPYILREFHHGLTRALQRSFYSFTHRYTKHKPQHFHQLGRRSLRQPIWDIDKQLASIREQYEMLFHVTPVNSDQAWEEFKASGYHQIPSFNYRPRPIDPDFLKRQLFNIPIENIEDPTLTYIFQTQRDEIDRHLNMINDRNKTNFLHGSIQVYGGVEPWLLMLAELLLAKLEPEVVDSTGETISAIEFSYSAKKLLEKYRQQVPTLKSKIKIRSDIPGVLVVNGHLMIGSHCRFLKNTVNATLAHEVSTHILTYYNGKAQPFHQFYSGMAKYEALQEGLAILSEYLVGQLSSRRLRILAARVIAVHGLIQGADFIEVFQRLHNDYQFSPYQSYFITMRVFRGGGFTKDAVYLRGFSDLLKYLGEGGELELLYLGKVAQENLDFVEELRWRKVLKDCLLIPDFLESEDSQKRLDFIRRGVSIIDLMKGTMQ